MMEKYMYRASGVGSCKRALGVMRLNMNIPPETTRIQRISRGAAKQEDWVIDQLVEEGYEVTERQKEFLMEYPMFQIQGHIEGFIRKEKKKLLEIKNLGLYSFREFQHKGLEAFRTYQYQVSVYMAAMGEEYWPLFLVVRNRDDEDIIKTDIAEPPVSMDTILSHLRVVEGLAQQGLLGDPEPDGWCRWCRCKPYCILESVPKGPSELAQYAQLYREGKLLELQAEEKLGEAKEAFQAYFRSQEPKKVVVDDLMVSLNQRSRKTYIASTLESLVSEDILAQCRKITDYEELRFKDDRD